MTLCHVFELCWRIDQLHVTRQLSIDLTVSRSFANDRAWLYVGCSDGYPFLSSEILHWCAFGPLIFHRGPRGDQTGVVNLLGTAYRTPSPGYLGYRAFLLHIFFCQLFILGIIQGPLYPETSFMRSC